MTCLARRRRDDDRGNTVVEAAVLATLFVLFVAALFVGFRIRNASGTVAQASADAARQASIARTGAQATQAAKASAVATLREGGLHCSPAVSVDVSGFARPVGQVAMVTATVTCTERLSDVALFDMPLSRTITRVYRSPIDPYRARSLGFAAPDVSSGLVPSARAV